MAFDVQAARDAGYSQEEIDAYLQGKPKTETITPVAPGQEVDPGEPPAPTTTVTPAGEGSMMPGLATTGMVAAGAALPFTAGYGVAKYGGRAMDMARNMIGGAGANAPGGANNPIGGTRIPISTPTAPAVPTAPQTQPPPTTQAGRAYSPQAQQFMQQRAQAPAPQMQAAQSIVQKLALSKLLPAAQMGAGLFYTSPEEIATLKAAEARKRAQGQ
jgi:hypothetical protein